ncbi:MAG: aldehyde ferredoxin oxidoreductase family protein [Proteobacteria bacterium]|nr:aldehyde ferredoxin oxidoreductase family protein [Pseudomonadota bacterium]
MGKQIPGYYGVLLEINLTDRKVQTIEIPLQEIENFIGGRGLGMKILWNKLNKPGIDALSPENPLMFMTGPFSGFPIASSSRTVVVTKSPCTSPNQSEYPFASTVAYSNIGGFIGPEIRFAGYDGIIFLGQASSPVYIVVDNDKVEIRDATEYWGMRTDEFDKRFIKDLGDRRFRTLYIGPAGENKVSYAGIMHTASRTAGRGVGCVMGSKNVKAMAVRGTNMPNVADHAEFRNLVESAYRKHEGLISGFKTRLFRQSGTTYFIETQSDKGRQAVKNFREGTFEEVEKISEDAVREQIWVRDYSCYCCPLSCKKAGAVKKGPYAGMSHDGPELETGAMLGSNLLISDLGGLMKAIRTGDDYGIDIISTGNVIGFLMEAYEKNYINKSFLDGIDLKWGNVDATLKMIEKIAKREGIGDIAANGVKALSKEIGKDSHKFAIHVKGLPLASLNVHTNPPMGLSYVTSTKGACHLNGINTKQQNFKAVTDSMGMCWFASDLETWYTPGYTDGDYADLLTAITGAQWTPEKVMKTGERVYNLEKMFNYREGFVREDDMLPDRFFEEPLTVGSKEGAAIEKEEFVGMLDDYYKERGWDLKTTKPTESKLKSLGLAFTLSD